MREQTMHPRRSTRTRATALVTAAVAAAGLALMPTDALAVKRRIVGTCGPCVWTPKTRTVQRGTKIVWKVPAGDVAHTVTAYRRNSKRWSKNVVVRPGQRTAKVFKRRGLYRFKCVFHPGMTGSVRVS